MNQVGTSFLVGSMYALYPESDWFIVVPLEHAFVNLQALSAFIETSCKKMKDCSKDKPIVFASNKALKGVVLVSRGAAKQAVLAGRSGLLAIPNVVIQVVDTLLVVTDMVSYQKEILTESYNGPKSNSCAVVMSTNVALSAMHWGLRESPQALANAMLRPPRSG
jgi:hypothetical protein